MQPDDTSAHAGSSSALLRGAKPNTPRSILTTLHLHSSKFYDVEIECLDGKKIQAHKAILAAREKYDIILNDLCALMC